MRRIHYRFGPFAVICGGFNIDGRLVCVLALSYTDKGHRLLMLCCISYLQHSE